jgi:MoaA/NifB/PqqE/SkfB family radical SAM enzyme
MKITEDNNRLVLDYHKLGGHMDRVEAWENGERIAPVSVDMSLTRACGAMCSFCYAMVQESQERSSIKELHALNLLDDFKEIGVRSVSLVSDGESTLAKAYIPFIKHAKEIGIDVANGTNAWEWDQEKIEEVLPCLTWVRFTVAAGTPDKYASMMYKTSKDVHVFDRAMKNISYAVDLKKRKKLSVTLGIQMVLMPNMIEDIIPFAQLGLALGVDYAVIKHCSDDEVGSLGIDYTKYEAMFEKLRLAELMSTEKTKIIVKWNKINDGQNFPYKRVHGPQFLLQISGSGLVAPAGVFFNSKFSKFHIGNFTEERFKDIWRSERYWRVMRYLASDNFDPQKMMGSLPIAHYLNIALDRHIKGIERIKDTSDNQPLHHNFL